MLGRVEEPCVGAVNLEGQGDGVEVFEEEPRKAHPSVSTAWRWGTARNQCLHGDVQLSIAPPGAPALQATGHPSNSLVCREGRLSCRLHVLPDRIGSHHAIHNTESFWVCDEFCGFCTIPLIPLIHPFVNNIKSYSKSHRENSKFVNVLAGD